MPDEPRPFWSGTLTFGLVNVPVQLFSAVQSGRGSLRMVDEDGTPLARRYICPREDRPLSRDEIVRGYDVSPSGSDDEEFVTVTEEELEGLQPEKSREIDLRRFVPVSDLDPVFFRRAYVLTPAEGSIKAYRLLARDGILRAETMRFHAEVRTPDDVGLAGTPDVPDVEDADDDRVEALVADIRDHERDDLDRDELEDRGAEELEALVEAKRKKGEGVVDAPGKEKREDEDGGETEVIDLMEVLRRSLSEG